MKSSDRCMRKNSIILYNFMSQKSLETERRSSLISNLPLKSARVQLVSLEATYFGKTTFLTFNDFMKQTGIPPLNRVTSQPFEGVKPL